MASTTTASWKHLLCMCDVPYSPLPGPAAALLKTENCPFLLGSLYAHTYASSSTFKLYLFMKGRAKHRKI